LFPPHYKIIKNRKISAKEEFADRISEIFRKKVPSNTALFEQGAVSGREKKDANGTMVETPAAAPDAR
jgi:hypothetical protein